MNLFFIKPKINLFIILLKKINILSIVVENKPANNQMYWDSNQVN